jgi:hypothetical protein
MTTSPIEDRLLAEDVSFVQVRRELYLLVRLKDGRAVGVPLALFPTLRKATPAQRAKWRLIGRGDGFQWPDLDLDLSVRGILHGQGEIVGATPKATSNRRRKAG